MIVAFINQKGGSGKSTLAVHAAAWLVARGRSVGFIDADAQQTSGQWMAEALPAVPVVRAHSIGAITDAARDLAGRVEVIVADGPAGLDEGTIALAGVADRVIVPCCPGVADLRAARNVVEMLGRVQSKRGAGVPAAVLVMNRVRRNTRLSADVISAAPALGLPVAVATVGLRDALADACGQGSHVFAMGTGAAQAAEELAALFTEVFA